MSAPPGHRRHTGLRDSLHEIVFEADTSAGRFFDIVLLIVICASVVAVMLDSMHEVQTEYGDILYKAEWFFTIVFTIEYIVRLYCVRRPLMYAKSFYGIVDLLAILPTYLSLLFVSSKYMLVIRILRLLRIFRVLKLVQYLSEAKHLTAALRASGRKIAVFLIAVVILVTILGSIMYVIEGDENGFTSIPRSIYWAIVTLTTVGYGDISPQTNLGRVVASIVMILGYGIIAVPTGIVTAGLSQTMVKKVSTQACHECSADGHDPDATHCKFCGALL